jgi:GT2 family glycosyltransferase
MSIVTSLKRVFGRFAPPPEMRLEEFDEDWYLTRYPDVAAGVMSGSTTSGRKHYIRHGFYEGRLGSPDMELALADADTAVGANPTRRPAGRAAAEDSHAHAVEALEVTPEGAVFFIGWIDDAATPLQSILLDLGHGRIELAGKRLFRFRRQDVELHLSVPYLRDYGVWSFAASGAPPFAPPECDATLRSARAVMGRSRPRMRRVSDVEMRNTVLEFFGTKSSAKNPWLSSARDLDAGFADAILDLNRRILLGGRKVTVTRFGGGRRPVRNSLVTCIYGSPQYLPLQIALFSNCERFDQVEFVYINNSPELAETLQRDAKQAARLYDVPITLIHADTNLGFAAANNVAAEHAASSRLLIVNPDVFPKARDWLVKHDTFATSDRGKLFGACLYYDDGSVMHAGMHFERDTFVDTRDASVELLRVEHDAKGFPDWAAPVNETRIVPAVTGAFMSIDRQHFERLGGFDEDYIFGHYEDADLCLKSAAAGQPVWYCADVRLWHMEGKGAGHQPALEGASRVNRWRFTRKWGATLAPAAAGQPEPGARAAAG